VLSAISSWTFLPGLKQSLAQAQDCRAAENQVRRLAMTSTRMLDVVKVIKNLYLANQILQIQQGAHHYASRNPKR
jgi:hypothetical protein